MRNAMAAQPRPPFFRTLVGAAGILLLAACGGGSGGSGTETGSLSLDITDAPVDGVTEVWVQFTGVRVKPADGAAIDFDFDTPLDIDLLTLTGANTETLLDNAEVPAGAYEWILLRVNAEFDDVMDSYVMDDMGGMMELRVPSGGEQGLRLVSGFTVLAGGSASFVIDWDLRQGLTDPVGLSGYFLRPALRITDLAEYGSISGTVADALVMDDTCTSDTATGAGNVVYLFEGEDVVPDDIDATDAEPLATAAVAQDDQAAGAYTYHANFLPPGPYTAAFTCQAQDDDPETSDELVFMGAQNATVVADQETVISF